MILCKPFRNGVLLCCREIDAVEFPAADFAEWLSQREIEQFETIVSEKRRKTWLAGRAMVKTAACRFFPAMLPRDIEMVSVNETGRGISPHIEREGRRCELHFSLSHTNREIAIAMTRDTGCIPGIDLVELRDAKTNFSRIRNRWLTSNEQSQVPPHDEREIARRWALKEAAYKSMAHTQTGFSPLHYEVLRTGENFREWQIRCRDDDSIRFENITALESRDSILALVWRQRTRNTGNTTPAS